MVNFKSIDIATAILAGEKISHDEMLLLAQEYLTLAPRLDWERHYWELEHYLTEIRLVIEKHVDSFAAQADKHSSFAYQSDERS